MARFKVGDIVIAKDASINRVIKFKVVPSDGRKSRNEKEHICFSEIIEDSLDETWPGSVEEWTVGNLEWFTLELESDYLKKKKIDNETKEWLT